MKLREQVVHVIVRRVLARSNLFQDYATLLVQVVELRILDDVGQDFNCRLDMVLQNANVVTGVAT